MMFYPYDTFAIAAFSFVLGVLAGVLILVHIIKTSKVKKRRGLKR
jgi:hypothetical protein